MSQLTKELEQVAVSLRGPFDLSRPRRAGAHTFEMETAYTHVGPTGVPIAVEKYFLTLSEDAYRFTITEFRIQTGDNPPAAIPALAGLSYGFDPSLTGADGREPMWGIPQDPFRRLADELGNQLTFPSRYAAYVSLVDFHSINDVFTRPFPFGAGIQDLDEIGKRIVHLASFVEAPVHFGSEIQPGSTFKNGEVTLELKGASLVDGAPCALVGYDAGESRLKMVVPDANRRPTVTEGGSRYRGDIYIDLDSGWVRKATLEEHLLAQTSTSATPDYTVRHILIRLAA